MTVVPASLSKSVLSLQSSLHVPSLPGLGEGDQVLVAEADHTDPPRHTRR